jgi:uncharacterized membrane protein YqjE
MLKPAEPQPPPGPEPSIADLIERLFDEALDYVRAEIELVKVRAREAVEGYLRAAILFGIAAVLGLAGVVTLFVGIALALARWIGPLGGAIVSTLLAAAAAGLLVWFAMREVNEKQ